MSAPRFLLPVLVLLAMATLLAALMAGSVAVDIPSLWELIQGEGSALNHTVILELRLPRALAAFAVGGLLALAGALMQVLLRNPLADPYILGVSGGAATAALLAMLAGLSGLALTTASFGGALFTILLVFQLARRGGDWNPTRMLLTGVVVASGWAAVIGFILAISPDTTLRGMLYWLMGDLSYAGNPTVTLLVLAIATLCGLAIARDLNVMTRGELQARALGINTHILITAVYLGASLCTAAAVTLAGSVGFVGLVVPHLLRLLGCTDHRLLLPAAVLLGGSLVVMADTLARTLLAPQQLPVGILTALLGVPWFLYLLNRRRTP